MRRVSECGVVAVGGSGGSCGSGGECGVLVNAAWLWLSLIHI